MVFIEIAVGVGVSAVGFMIDSWFFKQQTDPRKNTLMGYKYSEDYRIPYNHESLYSKMMRPLRIIKDSRWIEQVHRQIITENIMIEHYESFNRDFPYSEQILNDISIGKLLPSTNWFNYQIKSCIMMRVYGRDDDVKYHALKHQKKLLMAYYDNCFYNQNLSKSNNLISKVFQLELEFTKPSIDIIGMCFLTSAVHNHNLTSNQHHINMKNWEKVPKDFLNRGEIIRLLPIIYTGKYQKCNTTQFLNIQEYIKLRLKYNHYVEKKWFLIIDF
jgi:hypothetical protein